LKKIILYIAASLDQRIAEPNGSLDWLIKFSNSNKTDSSCNDLLASVNTILIGGSAYRELLNMNIIWPYQKQIIYAILRYDWGKKNTRFITDNTIEAISSLRNEPRKDILLVGGGRLISMLLAADMIEEMQIEYMTIILGEGIPLFPVQSKESKWKLTNYNSYNSGVLKVIYILNN
jgi:dihydrofolate reductase